MGAFFGARDMGDRDIRSEFGKHFGAMFGAFMGALKERLWEPY
jgi:hypothetical protein